MAGTYRIVRTDSLGGAAKIIEPYVSVNQSVIVTLDVPPPGDYIYHLQYIAAPIFENETVTAGIITVINLKR